MSVISLLFNFIESKVNWIRCKQTNSKIYSTIMKGVNSLNTFIKKLVGFSLGPIFGAFISLMTVPITTYFISPTEYGKASMFTVVQAMMATFIYLGIDQSYTREYHYHENKKELFQNALLVPIMASALLGGIIFVFSEQFSILLFSDGDYKHISILFTLLIVSTVIERFLLLSIRMEEKALEYSFFSIFVKVTVFILTLVLVLLGSRTFLTIVYSTILGQLIGDAFLIFRYRSLFNFKVSYLNKDLIKKMVLFGLPLIVAASLTNLLNTAGRFFLRGYSTYYELGIYTAALKIANVLQIVQTAFTSFWVPTAYRWHKEEKETKYFSYVADVLLFFMTLLFFGILFFKKVIVLILSANYSDAQYIAGLLALTPILYTLSETTTLGIVFSGKSYYNLWVSLLAIGPNLLLNMILVPRYGTVGAAIATAVAYIIFCMARTYFSRKSGFVISFWKQSINIGIFFLAALINTRSTNITLTCTIILFLVSLITQYSTIKDTINIKKSSKDWDFS